MEKDKYIRKNQKTFHESLTIALAGNPNVGKTSVFNALTGSHQHIGNWPGVTVEKKEGSFTLNGTEVKVVDLPGIYGLSAYSIDERIARDFLMFDKPDIVVAVVDSTNIERNLYLVLELLEMRQNVILDLNLVDEAEKREIIVNDEMLSSFLGVPVVRTVAIKKVGIEDLKKAIINFTMDDKSTHPIKFSEDLELHISKIQNILNKLELPTKVSSRWLAIKLLEQDPDIMKTIEENAKESLKELKQIVMGAISAIERKYNDDSSAVITQARYAIIHSIVRKVVKKRKTLESRISTTDKLDKIFTNRIFGIPIFFLMMWAVFQVTFSVGGYFADLIDSLFGKIAEGLSSSLESFHAPDLLISLISDGIIGGVGSVLVFLPNIFLLFLAIALLEDSGYMARAAFVMDRLMNAIGLSGKAFIPMILGFGCNVPAIMATRTIESEKDRTVAALVNPLMSCSARLPIYTLFATIFFSKKQGLVIFSIYVLGIILAIIMAKLFNVLIFKTKVTPLIMELPPYRLPSLKNAFGEATRRSSIFLKKAGSIIFAGVLILWILASFPTNVPYGSEQSWAGSLGKLIAPILKTMGFGFWQAGVALIFGTMAKEVVVGTFGTLYGGENLATALKNAFTPLSAYSFMVFSLIYIPCIATLGAIKRELGWKWAIFTLVYLPLLAYIVSTTIYQLGNPFVR
ncbi:MAG: ferrous iron transport protein B [Thermotogaceae bacterium]|nr:ferrous iron transport protein B [Thermotogaceae bacterium]